MDNARPKLRDRLSTRLTLVVMSWALVIGVVLAGSQILFDARTQSREVDRRAQQALDTLRRAAVEAVYEIDPDLAKQVLDGLAAYPGVYRAEIVMHPDTVLAERRGELAAGALRGLTDELFGRERTYEALLPDPRGGEPLGALRVHVDTWAAGQTFLDRALFTVGTGLMWAALLGVVLLSVVYLILTRPIEQLAAELHAAHDAPESAAVSEPERHARDELGGLARALNGLLKAIRDNLARRAEAEARASYLQQFDDLTGLPNRRLFMTRLAQALANAGSRGEPVAIVLFDLRDFRDVNKQHGTAAGDEVLRRVARQLEPLSGGPACLARLGDDVFALLVTDNAGRADVDALVRRALDTIAAPFELGGVRVELGAWVGAALYPDDAAGAEALMQVAEAALAQAKEEKATQVQFYDTGREGDAAVRRQLSLDLRRREVTHELALAFEPQVAATTGRVLGIEVLLRWKHPKLGVLRPASFIRLAEENGSIHALGEWVMREAAAKAMAWRSVLGEPLCLALNVSGAQLRRGHLDAQIARVVENIGLPPEALELEITETAIVENVQNAALMLRRVRELGVGIAIDDFGTGHASLGYLKQLPVSKLKIDMSFVRDVLTDANDATIVRAIIGLGHSLGLSVTAEGVETPEQRDFLTELGCDALQGMLFGCGLEEQEVLTCLRQRGGIGRKLHAVPPLRDY
jgi:diguanylate cyclase (GGDEF)-like protein